MNKHLYRVVFNSCRGLLMAVAETAGTHGKTTRSKAYGTSSAPLAKLRPLHVDVMHAVGILLLVTPTTYAQIRADAAAPTPLQPTILTTANGLQQVNIRTPSAAGVSRNHYSQFDVHAKGAILNNSRTSAGTRLGGWVQANPWLASGSAKVILNEINSSQSSQLRGYLEVAGQRAEVIIASPAGIQVNGGGFLNASGVTLTTGTPVLKHGYLDSYRVRGGTVSIDGAGLDASGSDYTHILARAVQVNAGIWARDLHVVTGSNQIDAARPTTAHTPTTTSGNAPAFALDVAALGGMYAGKIFLVGTEAGLGVRNSGHIGASAGNVVVQANGWLDNSGSIQASDEMNIRADGMVNSGLLTAGDALTLAASRIDNTTTGQITAHHTRLTARDTLDNRGFIDGTATRIDATTLRNVGTGRIYGDTLGIAAGTLSNESEATDSGTTAATISARQRLDIGAALLHNQRDALLYSDGDMALGGSLDASGKATGSARQILNSGGLIEALGNLEAHADYIANTNPEFAYEIQSAGTTPGIEYVTGQGTFSNVEVGWVLSAQTFRVAGPGGGYRYRSGQGRLLRSDHAYGDPVYQTYYDSPNAYTAAHVQYTSDNEGNLSPVNVPDSFSYTSSDPIWGVFGVDPPSGPHPGPRPQVDPETGWPPSPTAISGWEAAAAPWKALQTRLDTFRSTVNASAITFTGFREFNQDKPAATVTHSTPGRIFSGKDMTLHAGSELLNDQSQIVAGGTLGITGHAIDNRAQSITANARRSGRAYAWSQFDHGCGNVKGCDYNYQAYRDSAYLQDIPQTLALSTASALGQTAGTYNAPRSGTPAIPGPSSLFHVSPDPTGSYLIETDPLFTRYHNWLASDYMLASLGLDPAMTQKRLGDGFYEQRLVREQVATLTGRRFLGDHTNDEQQYRALMDAGITYAQAHQLRPGIALTAAQMAQLTSDIVWLVEQTVSLPDGTTRQALVPRLYTAVRAGDLDGGGSLLAGRDIRIALEGDLTNSGDITGGTAGTVAGRPLIRITVENVRNLGGHISGGAVVVTSRQDLNNIGGRIDAEDLLAAQAGRDLNLVSTIRSATNLVDGNSHSRTGMDRVAGLYLSGSAGTLLASAGRDIHLVASVIQSEADAHVQAGRDLSLETVSVGSANRIGGGDNYLRDSSRSDAGSQISATGHVTLRAGADIDIRAASVEAGEALKVDAGRDVRITAGQRDSDYAFGISYADTGLLSSTTTTIRNHSAHSESLGSRLGGQSVTIGSGQDTTLRGSHVVADRDVHLSADRNLDIEAATSSSSSASFHETRESGLMSGGGLSMSYGSREQSLDQGQRDTRTVASTVGSVDGKVALSAGKAYTQTGSDVLAPRGNVSIHAQTVSVVEARETGDSHIEHKFEQSGITVGVTSPVVSAIQTGHAMAKAASRADNDRMKALASANAALSGYAAYTAIDNGQGISINNKGGQVAIGVDERGRQQSRDASAAEKVGGLNITLSLGSSSSQSISQTHSDSTRGSHIGAGGSIDIRATGARQTSDVLIRGSSVQAGQDIRLHADDEVRLLAATNTTEQRRHDSISSGSVGASFGTSGWSVNASATKGQGQGNGTDTTHTSTRIHAGQVIDIDSEGDTTLSGAVIAAHAVTADVGGNLAIRSLQEAGHYSESRSNSGFSVSVPIGAGTASARLTAGHASANSDYRSVDEQSGIQAGDGGFVVTVRGNTDLIGGRIASTELAVQTQQNSLTTGTLTRSDLHNEAAASASASGISLGSDMLTQGKYGLAKGALANAMDSAGQSGSSTGETRSAVSTANITILDEAGQQRISGMSIAGTVASLNRDTEHTHTKAERLDVQAMRQTVEAERAIKNEAVKQLTTLTDESYRVMFRQVPRFYKVVCPPGANCTRNPELAVPLLLQGSPEEIRAEIADAPAGAVLAVNGLNNPLDRAAELAMQNAESVNKTDQNPAGEKPNDIYLMHYVPASNGISEALIGGYEKILASGQGYSNQDLAYADALQARGDKATVSLGHSRGTIVQTNANTILAEQGYTNSSLSVRGVGGAMDVAAYTSTAAEVTTTKEIDHITYSYFTTDPISVVTGGNPGVVSLSEFWRMLTTSNSAHSCYGTGSAGCNQVEILTPNAPEGAQQNNAGLLQYKGGKLVEQNVRTSRPPR